MVEWVKLTQDCPIEPCPQCSHPELWVQPMIDLEDEWIGANPQTPNNGNPCSMLDACTVWVPMQYVFEESNLQRQSKSPQNLMILFLEIYILYCCLQWFPSYRIPHDNYGEEDPQQVYDMLMKNFKRIYEGDVDYDGQLVPGNRAPWGLYMHAGWFFGDYGWHYTGYKQFIAVCWLLTIASQNNFLVVRKLQAMTMCGSYQSRPA